MTSRSDEHLDESEYSDDPIYEDESENSSLRGKLLALATAISLIALGSSFAANVNLGLGGSSEFGQGLLKTVACDSDGVTLKPENAMTSSGAQNDFRVSSITVSGISANCSGKKFRIRIYDTSSASPLTAVGFLNAINFLYVPGASRSTSNVAIEEGANSIKLTFVMPMSLSSQTSKYTIESEEASIGILGQVDTLFASPAITAISTGRSDTGKEVLIDSQGNLYSVISSRSGSSFEVVVRKYLKEGAVDTSYAASGVGRFNLSGGSVTDAILDRNNNLFITTTKAGINPISQLTKIDINGAIATSFGINGSISISIPNADRTYISEVAFDRNERILLGGHSCNDTLNTCNPYVARATFKGLLDGTFGAAGIRNLPTSANVYGNTIAVDANQRIYLAGDSSDGVVGDIYLFRVDEKGALDNSFGSSGAVVLDFGTISESALGITLNPRGGVYLAGFTNVSSKDRATIMALTSSGSLDTSFAGTGYVTLYPDATKDYWSSHVEVSEDGDLFLNVTDMNSDPNARLGYIAKVKANGSLASEFGTSGILNVINTVGGVDYVNNLIITSDNKLLITGYTGTTGSALKSFVSRIK